ncbi:Gfo/Idh/MocA family protein [Geomicrobium sp. JCM 19039]|uniref:Gfo/Idh/MocA family protein n=1 Tax=Geomicrobium sp. JCM 19039 TaxID=1460636 RepID=UPI00045F2A85|nr:Gfo/Idh/MocA family oxidoreductase [Geomicrobium sp. JCM 19039]GAK13963.1 dehydrogenase [Geomicrobium sp. JCM 19039]
MEKCKVGIVGCGNISEIYLKNLTASEVIEVVAVADLQNELAEKRAAQFQIPNVHTLDTILHDEEIELIVNLTPPSAHAEIGLKALHAGKHIYSEKPLGLTVEEGKSLIRTAKERNLRVGCAPDTFLGEGIQTVKSLIDQGVIGNPVAVNAFMLGKGPEKWHPNPEFFYQPGGGPLFDMGPYYLTTMIYLLGDVDRVSASAGISFKERKIGSGSLKGQKIMVNTPTHIAGTLNFKSGAIGTLVTSFDIQASTLPRIEVYGSEGTIVVPDPNRFAGTIRYNQGDEWEEVRTQAEETTNLRGVGVEDLVLSIIEGAPHQASGEMGMQVLQVMAGLLEAAKEEKTVSIRKRINSIV